MPNNYDSPPRRTGANTRAGNTFRQVIVPMPSGNNTVEVYCPVASGMNSATFGILFSWTADKTGTVAKTYVLNRSIGSAPSSRWSVFLYDSANGVPSGSALSFGVTGPVAGINPFDTGHAETAGNNYCLLQLNVSVAAPSSNNWQPVYHPSIKPQGWESRWTRDTGATYDDEVMEPGIVAFEYADGTRSGWYNPVLGAMANSAFTIFGSKAEGWKIIPDDDMVIWNVGVMLNSAGVGSLGTPVCRIRDASSSALYTSATCLRTIQGAARRKNFSFGDPKTAGNGAFLKKGQVYYIMIEQLLNTGGSTGSYIMLQGASWGATNLKPSGSALDVVPFGLTPVNGWGWSGPYAVSNLANYITLDISPSAPLGT